jgi:phosphodiesterase/alkaline phosphatase D-like protein
MIKLLTNSLQTQSSKSGRAPLSIKSIIETFWIFLIALLIPVSAFGQYRTEFADTVTLNSSDLPYTVPQSDLLIRISGDLTTSGTAIDVGDRNDIKIDGGGNIIYFGTGEYDNSYGVKLSYSPERIQIKNITLIHDVADESQALGCAPIHIMGDDSVWVENVYMVARGVEGNCLDATLLGGNGISNLWVKDCECDNLSHSFVNRSGDPSGAFRVCADGSTLAADQYTGLFENVTVTTTPHTAIYGTGSTSKRPKMIIHDCNLTVDAHNDMYDTTNATSFHSSGDAYAISIYRLGPGSEIYNNTIRSGMDHEGGQGMIIQGAQGSAAEPINIYNNDMQINCGPNDYNLRYGGDGKTVGLYLRWPDGNSNMSNCNVRFYNNLVKVYGDALKNMGAGGTRHTGSSAQGIRIHIDSGFHNVEVFNNRIFAMRSDSLVDTGTVSTIAAMYSKVDTNRTDTYALKHKLDVYNNVFKNNYYYAPQSPLYFGNGALHTLGGGSIQLDNDTIHVGTSAGASSTIEFPQSGTFRYSSTGSRLLDCVFMGYADDEGVVWGNINTDDNGLGKDLRLDRLMTVKVKNESGGNFSGASVWITNNYGQNAVSGTTDGIGEFTDTVTYKAFHYNSPSSTNTWYDSLSYNNFTVKAKSGSDSVLTTITVDDATVFPITVTLSGASGPPNNPPTTPTLASPSNSGIVTALTPTLTANNSSDADGDNLTYTYQVSSNSGFTAIVAQSSSVAEGGGGTTSWIVSSNLTNGNTYYWRVRASDGQDYSNYSSSRTFTVNTPNNAPSTPTLATPSNGGNVSTLIPTLTTNNSSDADGDNLTYTYQVSSNSGFTAIVAQSSSVVEGGGGVTSWIVSSSLTNGNTYYWRVRASDSQAYSNYSSYRTFSVNLANSAPSIPTLASPSNGGTASIALPALITNNSTDADGDDLTYTFQISTDISFFLLLNQESGVTEGTGSTTAWTVASNLSEGITYYWRVRAFDGQYYSEYSSAWSFTVSLSNNNAPSIPTLASPANGGTVTSVTPALTSNNASDADGDNLTYTLQVSSNSGFTSIVAQESGIAEGTGSTTVWTVNSNLTDGNLYYWRVRAYDGQDYSGYSSARAFTVDLPNNVPSTPTLTSPSNGGIVTALNPLLTANNSSDADGDVLTYTFQISSNSSFTVIVAQASSVSEGTGSTTSWTASSSLSDGDTYYWRVRAHDGEDYSGYSSARTFTVDTPNNVPSTPTLVSPSNGGIVTTLTPLLTANNSSDADNDVLTYNFQVSSNSAFTAIVAQTSSITEGTGSTTSWTVSSNLVDGNVYYWRVRVSDGEDYSGYATTRVFMVDLPNNPPSVPVLASPSNGQQVDALIPILTINNSNDADGDNLVYNFQVSSNSSFTAIISQSGAVAESTGPVTSWTVGTTLSNFTNYWWRVRAYDGTDSSAFSQSSVFYINFTEPNDPPSQPEANLPLPGDTCETACPILVVNNSNDPDGDSLDYYFEVWDEQQSNLVSSSPPIPEGSGGTTSWEVDTLDEGLSYRWRSRSSDGNEYAEWSSWADFSITVLNHAPSIPVVMLPADGDTLLGSTHPLIIYNSSDEDGDELTYQFKLCDYPDTTQVVENVTGVIEGEISTTTYETTASLTDREFYCWKVRAYDGEEYSDWTPERTFMHLSFIVSTEDVPVPISPKEGDIVSSRRPRFIIETSEADLSLDFYFEVADNPDFNNAIVSGPVAGSTSSTSWRATSNLKVNTDYFWRVKSTNSAWTEAIDFHVGGRTHVSPNPYKPKKHGEEVTFRNVPDDATITITTVDGALVDQIHVEQGTEVIWDVTNEMGVKLSSGVYLYYINSSDTAASGKFAVIR